MDATYRLRTSELTLQFVKLLKELYRDNFISITIEEDKDETHHLLSSKTNREILMKRIEDVKNRKNLVLCKNEWVNMG